MTREEAINNLQQASSMYRLPWLTESIMVAIVALESANDFANNLQNEFVHCRECKHWVADVSGCTKYVRRCYLSHWMVGENGYCVYGETND